MVFGLSLLGAIGLFVFERNVPLRALYGSHHLTFQNEFYLYVSAGTVAPLTINPDGTFDMVHPLGQVHGTVSFVDRVLTFEFTSIGGKALQAWHRDWPTRQLDLVRRTMWAAKARPTPAAGTVWSELAGAKDAAEGVQRLQKSRPRLVADPFAQPWQYEVQSVRQWRSINPSQPVKW